MRASRRCALFLEEVELELERSVLAIGHDTLRTVAQHLCFGATAKRARPQLVWHFARCLREPPPRASLVDVAVAAELIHSSSLLHDDVVDAGMTRRGKPSANARFGNSAAVLGGDMTLTLAMQRLAPHPRALTTSGIACVAQMTDAAIAEVDARWRSDLRLTDWEHIAAGKTAALFAWCAEAVSLLGASSTERTALARCAAHLGLAFQLGDDLLDLGFGEAPGKSRFVDLRNGNPNYAVIAAARAHTEVAASLRRLYGSGDGTRATDSDLLASVGAAVRDSPTTAAAFARLDDEVALALGALDSCASGGGHDEGVGAIAAWTDALTRRLDGPGARCASHRRAAG